MADSLHQGCPGHGESQPFRCRCGVMVYTYRGYETTARLRYYNVSDGTVHEHAEAEIGDTVECVCGVTVYRDSAGKRNMDGTAHTCVRPVTMPAPRLQKPETYEAVTPAPRQWRVAQVVAVRPSDGR